MLGLDVVVNEIDKLGYEVVGITICHKEFSDGYVPHGIVAADRKHSPFGMAQRWCTLRWCAQPTGVILEDGDYDYTFEEALVSLHERTSRDAKSSMVRNPA